jgi:hypothetical protein
MTETTNNSRWNMNFQDFIQAHHCLNVGNSSFIPAQEDIFNGDPATDVVNMKNYGRVVFIIQKGAGATGTATITVQSCDDLVPTTTTAIKFLYRSQTDGETWSEWSEAETTGFTTTAGANQMYEVAVSARELNGDDIGVRLKATEVVDSPCDGAILALAVEPRYAETVPKKALE